MYYLKHCPINRVRGTKADDVHAGAFQASVMALGTLVGINLCSASSPIVHSEAYSFVFQHQCAVEEYFIFYKLE